MSSQVPALGPARLGRPGLLALLGILALAATARFTALDWGLRHPVHLDERVYVENVVRMVEAGDLDHRSYTYPGLFYYLLAPFVALLGSPRYLTNEAYLVARGLVAAGGVLDVLLAFWVGRRLLGPAAGLTAALLLAVSPLDVRTAHQVRPDVLLVGFGFVALWLFRRLGALPGDLRAGLLVGLATAVKFTGLLLVPFYVAARLLAPGARLKGLVAAGLVTIGVVLAATPYALLHLDDYRKGPGYQLDMYYKARRSPAYLEQVASYAGHGARTVGPLGLALVAAGCLVALRREPRAWGPALLHPLTVLAVMSSASLAFPRLILPGMAVVWLLAAWPVELLARRSRALAALLALAAAIFPARGTLRYLATISAPSPQDAALDWFEARARGSLTVVETRPEGVEPGLEAGAILGIDRTRHDFVPHTSRDEGLRLLAREADLVVVAPQDEAFWGDRLMTVYAARQRRSPQGWSQLTRVRYDGPVAFSLALPRVRALHAPLELAMARLSSSERPEALAALRDGSAATAWSSAGPAQGREWLRLELGRPATIGRVELLAGASLRDHDPEIELRAGLDGQALERLQAVSARPLLEEQQLARRLGDRRQPSQVLVFQPRLVRVLELRQTGLRADPWSVAELRVFEYRGEQPNEAAWAR